MPCDCAYLNRAGQLMTGHGCRSMACLFGRGRPVIPVLVFILLLVAVLPEPGNTGGVAEGISGKKLTVAATVPYRFIIAGHTYGAHSRSVYPSASLLGQLHVLEALHPSFMILLGDIISGLDTPRIRAFEESFSGRVSFPLFNAVGNHDVADRMGYERHFGETRKAFRIRSELYVILDSEEGQGRITDDQLTWLNALLDGAGEDKALRSIFLFSHRLLWSIRNRPSPQRLPYKSRGPEWHPQLVERFDREIFPKMAALQHLDFYLVSGDIGCDYVIPLFFEHSRGSNIRFLATRLNDTADDAIIMATVSAEGDIRFTCRSLGFKSLMPLEAYTFDHWMPRIDRLRAIQGEKPARWWEAAARWLDAPVATLSRSTLVAAIFFALLLILLAGRRFLRK